MKEVQAPTPLSTVNYTPILFLVGSIEMGKAVKWQERVVSGLSGQRGAILNPRRDDWDSSWVQSIDNPKFKEQVEWELAGLWMADYFLVVFDPNTKSPITLLELGLLVGRGAPVSILCPPGFWRKGNVDIICHRYGIRQHENLDQAIHYYQTHPEFN